MKRIVLSLFTLFFINLIFSPIKISASEVSEKYYDFISEGIEIFFENKDINECHNISDYFDEELCRLLNAKIEMDKFQRQNFELEYQEYDVTIVPYEEDKWYQNDTEIYASVQVIRTWYYSSELTTTSELLDITIKNDNEKYIIIGCYNRDESINYGPIDSIFKNAQLTRTAEDIQKILDDYVTDFKEQCTEKVEQMQNEVVTVGEIDTRAHTTALRLQIMRDWARANFNKTSPTSPYSSITYYDFSQIQGAYDCTNFVSHALLAADTTMHDDGYSGIQGTDQWYYRDTANRSSSWAGVNQLYLFLTRSNPSDTNIGPYATEKELTYSNAMIGDIVQGHNGQVWRHSTIVTKLENSKVYVTGRSTPTMYNDNVLAETIYGTQRLLCLEGNYSGR